MEKNMSIDDMLESGNQKITWARNHMPVLAALREQFIRDQPLKGRKVGMALHVEAKTAVLVETLAAAGAQVAITGCNPLSTQDDVSRALDSRDNISCYAKYNCTNQEYYDAIDKVLDFGPDITIDDGADLIFKIHTERPEMLKSLLGGCEETTTGIHRLKSMDRDNALKMPVIAVNDAMTKYLFDNRYGTGQSSWDGIMRTTNLLIAGKNVVIGGYGWCGKGAALRAKGLGANVIVTEIDPVKALEARMDGNLVMPMAEAVKIGDIFLTATGNRDIIRKEHLQVIKDGAILANTGHFNVEINMGRPGADGQVRPQCEKQHRRIRSGRPESERSGGRPTGQSGGRRRTSGGGDGFEFCRSGVVRSIHFRTQAGERCPSRSPGTRYVGGPDEAGHHGY
jgi:adenosylhomocysteinase